MTVKLAGRNSGFSVALNRVRAIQSGAVVARQRAIGTLVRRLKTETVRTISGEILNLPQNKVRDNINVATAAGGKAVVVYASPKRLPLTDYKARWNKSRGVTVTTWRDSGPLFLPHAFLRPDKPGVWQRIPSASAGTKSGLVERLPIVQRKGPDIKRVFLSEGTRHAHGAVADRLKQVAQDVLAAEIARLIAKKET